MPHSPPYTGQPSSTYTAPLLLHTVVATLPCACPLAWSSPPVSAPPGGGKGRVGASVATVVWKRRGAFYGEAG
eukprot:574175-Alexandrium_andersonii.AAC.1